MEPFTKYSQKNIRNFLKKVDKKGDDECWIWTAGKTKDGYGTFRHNKKKLGAHRIALELHLGREITAGLDVCHAAGICHNPLCVNPHHLREDTPSANQLDRHVDGTMHSKITAEQVLQIRASDKMQKDLAVEYGVSFQTISKIILRKYWKHVK